MNAHHPKQPPLVSVGQLHRPALPSPRRQEWDDKGKALGVIQINDHKLIIDKVKSFIASLFGSMSFNQ